MSRDILVRNLRNFLAPQIQNQSSADSTVIGIAKSKISTIHTTPTPTEFFIGVQQDREALPYFVFDAIRFSNALIESAYSISSSNKNSKSIGWDIIKTYYAAFYAGNALLRLMGESFTYIDSASAKKIAEKHAFYGYITRITPGEYYAVYNSNLHYVSYSSLQSYQGGTHEKFWRILNNKLQDIESKILSNKLDSLITTDAQAIALKLASLREILTKNSISGAWLSQFRNDVTYKNPNDIWFPYKNIDADYTKLAEWQNLWLLDPMEIDIQTSTRLAQFYYSCHILMSLNRAIIFDLSEISTRRNNIYKNNPVRAFYQFRQSS